MRNLRITLARPAICQGQVWEVRFATRTEHLDVRAEEEDVLVERTATLGVFEVSFARARSRAPSQATFHLDVAHRGNAPLLIGFLPARSEERAPSPSTPWEGHERRESSTNTLPEPLRAHHAFFTRLRAATEVELLLAPPADRPELHGRSETIAGLRNVHGLVRRSLFERARRLAGSAILSSNSPECQPRSSEPLHRPHERTRIARLAETVFENEALCEWSTLDLETFGRAFEAFASGELRVSDVDVVRNAEPTSGYFFLFAEFAFATANALEERRGTHHPSIARWRAQCARLVLAEHLFLASYLPGDGLPLDFASYSPRTFDPHARERIGERELLALRRAYLANLDPSSGSDWALLQERHACLALRALTTWVPAAVHLREQLLLHGHRAHAESER